MITKNFEDYPEHRLKFFSLLRAIGTHCFQALIHLSSQVGFWYRFLPPFLCYFLALFYFSKSGCTCKSLPSHIFTSIANIPYSYVLQLICYCPFILFIVICLPSQQLKLVMDSINWAFRHTERNIAETGLNLLLEMMKNFQVRLLPNPWILN